MDWLSSCSVVTSSFLLNTFAAKFYTEQNTMYWCQSRTPTAWKTAKIITILATRKELKSLASLVSQNQQKKKKKKSPKKTQDSKYCWNNTFSHTQKRQSEISFNGCVNPSWLAGVPGSSHRATGLCAPLPTSQQKDFDPSSVKSGTLKTGIWLKSTDIHASSEQRNTIEHETRKDISWIGWQVPLYRLFIAW